MTKIYLYSAVTGEYLEVGEAEDSADGVPQVPPFATLLAPPTAGDKQAAVFADGAWSLVADYRGGMYFDGATGVRVVIELGQVPDNLVSDPPAPVVVSPADQLAKLDQIMPPWAEALVAAVFPQGPAPVEIQTILDQKAALRAQLAQDGEAVTEGS
jgi:hypothetical protein